MCVRKRKYVYVCECDTFKFHIIMKLWECVCENRFLRVFLFYLHIIVKLWECVCENRFLRVFLFYLHIIVKLW